MPLVEEVVACRRPAALLCAATPSRPCYLHHSVGTPLLARTASLGSLQGGARVRCWAGVAYRSIALSGGHAAHEMLSGARQELPYRQREGRGHDSARQQRPPLRPPPS